MVVEMAIFLSGKTPNIATEFAEIAEIAMAFLKIAKIAISLSKKNTIHRGPEKKNHTTLLLARTVVLLE